MSNQSSPGQKFREAVEKNNPLQVVGAVNAYNAIMAEKCGHKALYISGGGVAACSLGTPDLGISTLHDVLEDARRITDASSLPLLVDIDTGWGGAFNISRCIREMIRTNVAGVHIEDQVMQKRCGHRPNKAIVSQSEMVDRVKAAVDGRSDDSFVIMARTDALAVEGMQSAIDRAQACVEAGADMIFPEAVVELEQYQQFVNAVNVPILANITEFGATPFIFQRATGLGWCQAIALSAQCFSGSKSGSIESLPAYSRRWHSGKCRRHHADTHGVIRLSRLSPIRTNFRSTIQ